MGWKMMNEPELWKNRTSTWIYTPEDASSQPVAVCAMKFLLDCDLFFCVFARDDDNEGIQFSSKKDFDCNASWEI